MGDHTGILGAVVFFWGGYRVDDIGLGMEFFIVSGLCFDRRTIVFDGGSLFGQSLFIGDGRECGSGRVDCCSPLWSRREVIVSAIGGREFFQSVTLVWGFHLRD